MLKTIPLLIALLTTLTTHATQAADKPLNILFVFCDDHAAQTISAYGSVLNKTPNIDRLAKQGVLFENSFCTNSLCGPSRASMLTGKHSHANGFKQNGERFNADQPTFPKMQITANYHLILNLK